MIILSDDVRLHICLLAVVMFHKLTSLKPSTRIFVSKATRSSKTATSQKPSVVFRSMLLQGGLTVMAKPSTQIECVGLAAVYKRRTDGRHRTPQSYQYEKTSLYDCGDRETQHGKSESAWYRSTENEKIEYNDTRKWLIISLFRLMYWIRQI